MKNWDGRGEKTKVVVLIYRNLFHFLWIYKGFFLSPSKCNQIWGLVELRFTRPRVPFSCSASYYTSKRSHAHRLGSCIKTGAKQSSYSWILLWLWFSENRTYHHEGPVCWRGIITWPFHLNSHWLKEKKKKKSPSYFFPLQFMTIWLCTICSTHLKRQSWAVLARRRRPRVPETKAAPSLWTDRGCPPTNRPPHWYPAETRSWTIDHKRPASLSFIAFTNGDCKQ